MPIEIFFHKRAAQELKKLDKPTKERIKKEINELAKNPEKGKHLQYCNFRSLRIGDYRAIYEIKKQEQKIIILYIGHRKNVYEEFEKLF
jgi:mRNA interferase RelE/StbE